MWTDPNRVERGMNKGVESETLHFSEEKRVIGTHCHPQH